MLVKKLIKASVRIVCKYMEEIGLNICPWMV